MTSPTTARRRRTASMTLLAVTAMVALSGCFKLDMELELASDDTVDGSIVVAAQRSFAELAGGEDALRDSLSEDGNDLVGEQPSSGSVETKDYEDDDWIGIEYVLEDVPLAEFGGSDAEDLSITREGDEFVVAGTLDMSGGVTDDPSATAMLEDAEIEISVTFPGGIVSSNGEEDGNTVTWTPTAGEVLELDAVGKAEGGLPWATVGAVAAVLLLAVIGVVLLLVVRRRQPAPAAAPAPSGSVLPGGEGIPTEIPPASDEPPPPPPPAPPVAPPPV